MEIAGANHEKGAQTIQWIDDVSTKSSRSSIRINGELISLGEQKTLNIPVEDWDFTLGMVNQWDQIKLYEFGDQTIIAVSMSQRACTGLGCSIGAQIWYDVNTKQKTYFGTYRSDPDVRLFYLPESQGYFLISTHFEGDPHHVTAPAVMRYEFYKLQTDGSFRVQTDAKGKNYFLKHTSFPDAEFSGDKIVEKKARTPDCLEQNWVEDVLAHN